LDFPPPRPKLNQILKSPFGEIFAYISDIFVTYSQRLENFSKNIGKTLDTIQKNLDFIGDFG